MRDDASIVPYKSGFVCCGFVMRSAAKFLCGGVRGTPPYRLFFMSVTHHKYSVGNGLDRSGASCLYPIIEFTTGPVRAPGRCPLQIKYYAITFLGTLVLFFYLRLSHPFPIEHVFVQPFKGFLHAGQGQCKVHADGAGAVEHTAILPGNAHIPAGFFPPRQWFSRGLCTNPCNPGRACRCPPAC